MADGKNDASSSSGGGGDPQLPAREQQQQPQPVHEAPAAAPSGTGVNAATMAALQVKRGNESLIAIYQKDRRRPTRCLSRSTSSRIQQNIKTGPARRPRQPAARRGEAPSLGGAAPEGEVRLLGDAARRAVRGGRRRGRRSRQGSDDSGAFFSLFFFFFFF